MSVPQPEKKKKNKLGTSKTQQGAGQKVLLFCITYLFLQKESAEASVFILVCLFVCLDKVSCVSVWPLIYYLAKNDMLLILLPPPPSLVLGLKVCMHHHIHLFGAVLRRAPGLHAHEISTLVTGLNPQPFTCYLETLTNLKVRARSLWFWLQGCHPGTRAAVMLGCAGKGCPFKLTPVVTGRLLEPT